MSAILTVISASGALEGPFEVFLGESSPTTSRVFDSDRFPNIIVAMDGSVLAFWNGVKLRRSEDGGQSWGEPIAVGEGFMGGGVTVNEGNGEIFAFVEANHPPADLVVYRSRDHGKAWETFETKVMADSLGHVPSMHMNEHGISLRHGRHAGRLLRPTRWYAGKNDRTRWPEHYTNAIYSDDGGRLGRPVRLSPPRGRERRPSPNCRTGSFITIRGGTGRRKGKTRDVAGRLEAVTAATPGKTCKSVRCCRTGLKIPTTVAWRG